jgi:putative transposase
VSPAVRRDAVRWAQSAYRVSERRACRALIVSRSSTRYRSVRASDEPLRARLRELAAVRVAYGYRQLHTLLRREGWPINGKRVYRLYRQEGLVLRRKRPRRRRSAAVRQERTTPERANQAWAMDFVHDTLHSGESIRVLTLIDLCTRECLALPVKKGFRGEDVVRILTEAGAARGGLPETIAVDNGSEFTSMALDHWAYWNKVRLDFSRPGKPTDNPYIEAFNSILRREFLSQHWFIDLADAECSLQQWRSEYNTLRPHGSLGRLTPADFAAGAAFTPGSERLENLQT